MIAKIITFVKSYWHDLFVLACIALIALISYDLGQSRALRKTPIAITQGGTIYTADSFTGSQTSAPNAAAAISTPRDQRVVASKNSTSKLYYFIWCATAKRIKQENQIWFSTAALAQQAGYTLGGNCQ